MRKRFHNSSVAGENFTDSLSFCCKTGDCVCMGRMTLFFKAWVRRTSLFQENMGNPCLSYFGSWVEQPRSWEQLIWPTPYRHLQSRGQKEAVGSDKIHIVSLKTPGCMLPFASITVRFGVQTESS